MNVNQSIARPTFGRDASRTGALHVLLTSCALLLAGSLHAADVAGTLQALARYESGGDVVPLRQVEQWVAQGANDPVLRRDLEAGLAKLLEGNATYEGKRFACQHLAVIGGEASVPALAGLLLNQETAGIGCAALAQNSSAAASAALRSALTSTKGRALAQVALALGVRRDTEAVSALTALAKGSDLGAAEAAVISLGKIGTPAAAETLAQLRMSGPAELARAVADASFQVAARLATEGNAVAAASLYQEYLPAKHPEHFRRGALGALLRLDADQGSKRMQEVLAGGDATLKPVAIAHLPALQGDDAAKPFAGLLPKLEASDRILLLQALAERKDTASQTAVAEQLNSTDKPVRLAAVKALGQFGDAATVRVLLHALQAAKGEDELQAIELAFSSLAGGDAVDKALIAEVMNRRAGPKAPALGALVRRGSLSAKQLFIAETRSADPKMAKLAFRGLSRVAKEEDIPSVLKALSVVRDAGVEEAAIAAAGQILERLPEAAQRSAPVLEAMKTTTDEAATGRLLRLLPICGDATSLVALATAVKGGKNREVAVSALADWPNASAWEPLIAVWRQPADASERLTALRGLSRLLGEHNAKPDEKLAGRYRELLQSAKDDNDRKLVLGPLAGYAHPDALSLAVEQLAHPGVRAEAELAVKKIAEAIKATHPQAAQQALEKLKSNR